MKDYPVIEVELSELELAPWNYKEEDAVIALKLQNSMEKNGYATKITIAQRSEEPKSKKYEVIDGNHRLMAFREMKVKKVNAVFVGRKKKTERQRMGLEMNELQFPTDTIRLAENLKDLTADFAIEDLVLTLPYSEDEAMRLMQVLEIDRGAAAGTQSSSTNQGSGDEEWIHFHFGDIKGSVERVAYDRFREAVERMNAEGVTNLTNQIEYLCVEKLNVPQEAASEG